jgi:hypothetical protein
MAELGRMSEASVELERLLPRLLAGSGPRWLGAMADLSVVAAAPGNATATAALYDALLPYQGRLVIWGGANTVTGPVNRYLGLLAHRLDRPADALAHLDHALAWEEETGALPGLARTLAARAEVLAAQSARGPKGQGHQEQGDRDRAETDRRRARSIAERLGLRMLFDSLTPPADEWRLVRDGPDWLLEAGSERARLRDGRGLHYLRDLLAAPGWRRSTRSWTTPTASATHGRRKRLGSSATPYWTSCVGTVDSAAGRGPWISRPSGPGSTSRARCGPRSSGSRSTHPGPPRTRFLPTHLTALPLPTRPERPNPLARLSNQSPYELFATDSRLLDDHSSQEDNHAQPRHFNHIRGTGRRQSRRGRISRARVSRRNELGAHLSAHWWPGGVTDLDTRTHRGGVVGQMALVDDVNVRRLTARKVTPGQETALIEIAGGSRCGRR